MYYYVSCIIDIGYVINILSKFSSTPSGYHYNFLKNLARYLCITRDWGMEPKFHPIVWDENTPKPNQYIDKGELMYFVYTLYGNEPTKRISTTVFNFTFSGGVVVYRSKTQSINVLSSKEADLIDAVTSTKTARFMNYILW